jgi:putative flippase GtrA
VRKNILQIARDERTRSVARYLAVGLLSYGVDIGILTLCWSVIGLPLWMSTSAGYWVSFGVNFLLSRHWTFGVSHLAPGSQLLRYSVLVAVNFVVTLLAVTGLHRIGLGVLVAKTITLAVLTASTFIVYRTWVFTDKGSVDV